MYFWKIEVQSYFDWGYKSNKPCIKFFHTGKFDTDACQYWDKFYGRHQDKFFKDRNWLFLEFPELLPPGAKSEVTNRCQSDQQAVLTTGSSTETNKHHRSPDTADLQESCQKAVPEKDDAATQTATFPGQHASFRILEVCKTVQMFWWFDCNWLLWHICSAMFHWNINKMYFLFTGWMWSG